MNFSSGMDSSILPSSSTALGSQSSLEWILCMHFPCNFLFIFNLFFLYFHFFFLFTKRAIQIFARNSEFFSFFYNFFPCLQQDKNQKQKKGNNEIQDREKKKMKTATIKWYFLWLGIINTISVNVFYFYFS